MKLWTIYHVCMVDLEDEVWKLWALQCTNFVMMSSEISIGYFFTRAVKAHSKYFYGTSRLFTRLHDMSLVNPIYKSSCDNVETVYISKNSDFRSSNAVPSRILRVVFRQATICSHNCRLHYIEMKHFAWNHSETWELFLSGKLFLEFVNWMWGIINWIVLKYKFKYCFN